MQLLGPWRQRQLVSLFSHLPTSAPPTGSVGLPLDPAETHPFLGCLLLLVDTDSGSRANMAPVVPTVVQSSLFLMGPVVSGGPQASSLGGKTHETRAVSTH